MNSKYKLAIWLLASIVIFSRISAKSSKKSSKNQKSIPIQSITNMSENKDTAPLSKAKEDTLRELEVNNAIRRADLERQLTDELAEVKMDIERMKLNRERAALIKEIELEEIKKKHELEIAKLKNEKELLAAEIELEIATRTKEVEKFNSECVNVQKKIQKLKLEQEKIEGELKSKNLANELDKYAENSDNEQLLNPLKKDGTLVISERKIKLNGIITPWKARYILDSISFYNNKSSVLPIFLIIENSPGGSVNAGQQILKGIEDSKAPIYAVVTGYACSMAAVIATLSPRSFILKNAIMVHHQPSRYFDVLNVRKSKEFYEEMKELNKRLLGPVAKKMGISLEKFDELLYKNNADGDWMLFGDKAVEIKWADNVIVRIHEAGIKIRPEMANYSFKNFLNEYYQFGFDNHNKDLNEAKEIMAITGQKDYYYMYDPNNQSKIFNKQAS